MAELCFADASRAKDLSESTSFDPATQQGIKLLGPSTDIR
jgi:hypothetical protein